MEVQHPGPLHAPTGADASSFSTVNFDRLNDDRTGFYGTSTGVWRAEARGAPSSRSVIIAPMIAAMDPTPMTPINATPMTIPCFLDLCARHVFRGGDTRLRCQIRIMARLGERHELSESLRGRRNCHHTRSNTEQFQECASFHPSLPKFSRDTRCKTRNWCKGYTLDLYPFRRSPPSSSPVQDYWRRGPYVRYLGGADARFCQRQRKPVRGGGLPSRKEQCGDASGRISFVIGGKSFI